MKYEAILINSPELVITTSTGLNPAQFLYGDPMEPLAHDCLEVIHYQTKVREDLMKQELEEGEKYFIDRSSRCIQGKRISGYAVVNGSKMQTIEKGKIPSHWSVQSCE